MTDFFGYNQLYPVFLKLDVLHTLIVGGGNAAAEKLHFILKSSPNARLTLVSPQFSPQIEQIVQNHPLVTLLRKPIEASDLEGKHIAIVAIDDKTISKAIYDLAKTRNILINIADTPELCDFYLGSIVTKGDLKIAISTNGKSPTFSKRFREILEETLPDDLPQLLLNLNKIRDNLKTDFAEKVKKLNEITSILINGNNG